MWLTNCKTQTRMNFKIFSNPSLPFNFRTKGPRIRVILFKKSYKEHPNNLNFKSSAAPNLLIFYCYTAIDLKKTWLIGDFTEH